MSRKKMLINKKITKKVAGKCFFCDEDNYSCLHCHRIIPGEEGGLYTDHNSLVVCSNCHNKIHSNQIKIDRKYTTTLGKTVLHYWINEQEMWREVYDI
jgi:hypothetical protein